MAVLTDEFSRQASMENELGIPSSLLAPPKKDVVSLARGQLGFMNLFAIPLFQGVADIMPAMKYTVEELEINKGHFEKQIRDELAKEEPQRKPLLNDGAFSPRSMSLAVDGDMSKDPVLGGALTPGILVDGIPESGKEFSPPPVNPTNKPAHIPNLPDDYKEVNGIFANYDAVADFAASDPFNLHQRMDSCAENRTMPSGKQRCSETTDGSTGPYSGDWASQATSATTGKMPLSPSTQGTSIVSRESMERPPSVPHAAMSIPEVKLSIEPKIEPQPLEEESNHSNGSNGTIGKADGKALKKRPSRFRMNAFPFFRWHKGSSPPMPAADTAG
jgi:3'5'-cyclic nucleotide phosphodiesterase